MKYPNDKYYIKVKDKRYLVQPNENEILRERNPPKSREFNIRYKIKEKVERIKKLFEMLLQN